MSVNKTLTIVVDGLQYVWQHKKRKCGSAMVWAYSASGKPIYELVIRCGERDRGWQEARKRVYELAKSLKW